MFVIFVDLTQLIITPVPTVNSTKAGSSGSSSSGGSTGGAVGGVVSFLLIVVLCVTIIIIICYVRYSYKKKKAYCINQRVHYKANELGSDVHFYPNLHCDVDNENTRTYTMVYNDYNIITNSANDTSKSSKKITVCM